MFVGSLQKILFIFRIGVLYGLPILVWNFSGLYLAFVTFFTILILFTISNLLTLRNVKSCRNFFQFFLVRLRYGKK